MDERTRAFYEYHSCLMEPWDGPASMAFTDGTQIGACSIATACGPRAITSRKDDLVIMASEVGRADIPPETSCARAACNPAACSWSTPQQGRIVEDEEIKRRVASEQPYRQWLDEHLVDTR